MTGSRSNSSFPKAGRSPPAPADAEDVTAQDPRLFRGADRGRAPRSSRARPCACAASPAVPHRPRPSACVQQKAVISRLGGAEPIGKALVLPSRAAAPSSGARMGRPRVEPPYRRRARRPRQTTAAHEPVKSPVAATSPTWKLARSLIRGERRRNRNAPRRGAVVRLANQPFECCRHLDRIEGIGRIGAG
jgi:hypothetical protein